MKNSFWQAISSVTPSLLVVLVGFPAMAEVRIGAQVPLEPRKIPQFAQELPRLGSIAVVPPAAPSASLQKVDLSMCEFQAEVLPPGTPVAGEGAGSAPKTWVWGYQISTDCSKPAATYIGPVVVATRGIPTEVTYRNLLGDATTSKLLAFQRSTDQTLFWADPLSLLWQDPASGEAFPYPPPRFGNPAGKDAGGHPETNDCDRAEGVIEEEHDLPAPCADNYGFWRETGGTSKGFFGWLGALFTAEKPAVAAMTYAAPIPAAPHLHGGEIPAMLDGGPDAWWTGDGIHGHGYYSRGGVADAASGKAVYTYPNVQEAAPLWFHDHVLGATRLNVYAGLAGSYYLVDPGLVLPAGMDRLGLVNGSPAAAGGPATVEPLVPLVIQDRMFDTNGQLIFPNEGLNPEHPYWVPEFVGDVIVVNGKAWPTVTVEPKRYRFLLLNGSNARSYELFLLDPSNDAPGPSLWVIGNDQGYLDDTVEISRGAKAPNNKLIIMPGERYEVIVDFSSLAPGTTLEMRNTARTPYPEGDPVEPGTTGKILRFQVTACSSGFCGAADASFNPAPAGKSIRPAGSRIVRLANPANGTPAIAVQKTRRLTLNETIGEGGPLEVLVNNTTYGGAEGGAPARTDFTGITTRWNTTYYSELPHEGETEIWEIVNITADAHPIHPHLVAFQILNREAFGGDAYKAAYELAFGGWYRSGFGPPLDYNCGAGAPGRGPARDPLGKACVLGGNPDITLFLSGGIRPPLPAEQGWKDTAISYPDEVLRIIVRFAPTDLPSTAGPDLGWYEFDPNQGHGYVWHCHIIDHEDNEMMRPFSVRANPNPAVVRRLVLGVDY